MGSLAWIGQCGNYFSQVGVVAKGLAEVDEQVFVTRGEDEATAQLQRILAQSVLPMTTRLGPISGGEIVAAQQVAQARRLQAGSAVSLALLVDQQGEGDPGFVTKCAGVVGIAQADGSHVGSGATNLRLEVAQLRDVLTAENSPVVAQKNQYRGRFPPKITEPGLIAVHIG